MRSDCVCQNWHCGHPEAALSKRLPSLVCVLPAASRFQMKGAKREKNEISINQSLLGSIIGKMLLACPPPAAIHFPSPLSFSFCLLPWGLMRLFLCSVAASASMCKARPSNCFPSLDFGQAWQLAVATSLSHGLFVMFLLPSQPGCVINWEWEGGSERATNVNTGFTTEQPGELSDLYLFFSFHQVFFFAKKLFVARH